jgi:hypothetical protein
MHILLSALDYVLHDMGYYSNKWHAHGYRQCCTYVDLLTYVRAVCHVQVLHDMGYYVNDVGAETTLQVQLPLHPHACPALRLLVVYCATHNSSLCCTLPASRVTV